MNYFEDDHYCIVEYLKHISHAVREHVDRALSRKSQHDQMIAMALGRATVADAADLFIPIMDVKQGQSPAIHFNDGVFTSFIDFPLHRWRYNLKAVKPDGSLRKGKLKPFMVFGRSCDSGDHLGTVDLS